MDHKVRVEVVLFENSNQNTRQDTTSDNASNDHGLFVLFLFKSFHVRETIIWGCSSGGLSRSSSSNFAVVVIVVIVVQGHGKWCRSSSYGSCFDHGNFRIVVLLPWVSDARNNENVRRSPQNRNQRSNESEDPFYRFLSVWKSKFWNWHKLKIHKWSNKNNKRSNKIFFDRFFVLFVRSFVLFVGSDDPIWKTRFLPSWPANIHHLSAVWTLDANSLNWLSYSNIFYSTSF